MCPHAHPPLADAAGTEVEHVCLLILNKKVIVQGSFRAPVYSLS